VRLPEWIVASRPQRAGSRTVVVRDLAFRAERRLTKEPSQLELRQGRSVTRAFNGRRPPELLVIGDSDMFWTSRRDEDRRHLSEVIRDELDPAIRIQTLCAASYGPLMAMAFLDVLARCEHRPRLIVVPSSLQVAATTWLAHPVWGYARSAAAIRAAAQSGVWPEHLDPVASSEWDAHDRLVIPSLEDRALTVGEVRLVSNGSPRTPWQERVRLRTLLDYYMGERFTAQSPGIRLVAELGALIAQLGVPAVAYAVPVDYELMADLFGPSAREHVAANASLMASTFCDATGGLGAFVDATFECAASEFTDPLHVDEAGRRRLGARIAEAGRRLLAAGDASGHGAAQASRAIVS